MPNFSYWEAEDTAQHDCSFGEELSTEEAQVVATIKIAENLGRIASTLDEIFNLLQKYPIDVNIKDMPS